jgi:hypothetical protein
VCSSKQDIPEEERSEFLKLHEYDTLCESNYAYAFGVSSGVASGALTSVFLMRSVSQTSIGAAAFLSMSSIEIAAASTMI